MKQFELIYSPEKNKEMLLFTGLDLNKLTDPISISREDPIQEEEIINDTKKSELVDYEDENYLKLKEEEQLPFILIDNEQKSMSGMFQDSSDNGSMYFAFVNTGSYLKVIPISKWYKFVQKNQFFEPGDVDKVEKILNIQYSDSQESDIENHEIDYEETFDDDNEEDNEVAVLHEKKLSSSGRKIQNIMESYEDGLNDEKEEEEKQNSLLEEVESSKKAKTEKILSKADIRAAFSTDKISVKDLLMKIKDKFKIGEQEKNLIREFIHENCTFKVDPKTGEKNFKLK